MTIQNNKLNFELKLLAKSSVIVFIAMIFSKLASFIYRVVIANYLGSEIYGIFSLSLMIIVFFIYLSSLGLQEGLARYIPFYRGKHQVEKIKYIFQYSLKIVFFTTILTSFLLFFSSDIISVKIFHNLGLSIFLKWFAVFIPIAVFASFFHLPLRAYEKIKWYMFTPYVLQPFSQLIVLVVFLLN